MAGLEDAARRRKDDEDDHHRQQREQAESTRARLAELAQEFTDVLRRRGIQPSPVYEVSWENMWIKYRLGGWIGNGWSFQTVGPDYPNDLVLMENDHRYMQGVSTRDVTVDEGGFFRKAHIPPDGYLAVNGQHRPFQSYEVSHVEQGMVSRLAGLV